MIIAHINTLGLLEPRILKTLALGMVKHADILQIIKHVNTVGILNFGVTRYAGTPGIIKHANTVTHTYRKLVTTLNFPCSVPSPISVHCTGNGRGKERGNRRVTQRRDVGRPPESREVAASTFEFLSSSGWISVRGVATPSSHTA
jgi:hypothetical protein